MNKMLTDIDDARRYLSSITDTAQTSLDRNKRFGLGLGSELVLRWRGLEFGFGLELGLGLYVRFRLSLCVLFV